MLACARVPDAYPAAAAAAAPRSDPAGEQPAPPFGRRSLLTYYLRRIHYNDNNSTITGVRGPYARRYTRVPSSHVFPGPRAINLWTRAVAADDDTSFRSGTGTDENARGQESWRYRTLTIDKRRRD